MRRLSDRRITGDTENTVNPMDGLGNLADAMLVLAVGIMVALILNWRVDIASFPMETPEPEPQEENRPIPLNGEDLSDSQDAIDEADMHRVGALYYDEGTGMYYAVVEEE